MATVAIAEALPSSTKAKSPGITVAKAEVPQPTRAQPGRRGKRTTPYTAEDLGLSNKRFEAIEYDWDFFERTKEDEAPSASYG